MLNRLGCPDGLRGILQRVALGQLRALNRFDLGLNLRLAQVANQGAGFTGRHKNIYVGVCIEELLAGLDAHHAAHERQGAVGMTTSPGLETAQLAHCLIFCALTDDARVQNNHVRLVELIRRAVADLLQLRCNVVGVCHIHLAADGPNVVLARSVRSAVRSKFDGFDSGAVALGWAAGFRKSLLVGH